MAISRAKKEEVIRILEDSLKNAHVVIFTNFQGMDVVGLTNLRANVRQSGGTYLVARKRLIARALESAGITGVNPVGMEGEIALAFGMTDVAATSKAVYQAQKETEQLQIISGIMDGAMLSAAEVVQLATLPSREELLAKVVGTIAAPASSFVRVLNGNMRGLVYALQGIADQKA
ncbi:MAG: 50S ribosomal protein L10 [Candidatus Spechtbacterales bacterium]